MAKFNRVSTWAKRRCLAKHRLRKDSFLAMYDGAINYAIDSTTGQRIETQGIPLWKVANKKESGEWIIHYVNGTREFYEQIDDDKWEIVSWDPLLNEICIGITTQPVPADSGGNPLQNYRMSTVPVPNMKNYEF